MAPCRPRVVLGVLGGIIAAMTLQGCIEESINALIEKTCSAKSGEFFEGLKVTIIEKVTEKCMDLIGNDTAIRGKSCETEVTKAIPKDLVGFDQDNFTAECISDLTAKYETHVEGGLFELPDFVINVTQSFFDDHQDKINDIKDKLIDEAVSKLGDLKDDTESTPTDAAGTSGDAPENGNESNSTGAAETSGDAPEDDTESTTTDAEVTPARLYVVADAHNSVGAPRLATGSLLAMIATGTLAVAVAASSCSRRRGFQVVTGDEQAADGTAQLA